MSRTEMDEMWFGEAVLVLAHEADKLLGATDPRDPFLALMTAAAVAGHIIDRDPAEMHEVLDKVMGLAEALLLHSTETKP